MALKSESKSHRRPSHQTSAKASEQGTAAQHRSPASVQPSELEDAQPAADTVLNTPRESNKQGTETSQATVAGQHATGSFTDEHPSPNEAGPKHPKR